MSTVDLPKVTVTDRFGHNKWEIPACVAGVFGLRAFPGKTFQLNLDSSYGDQFVVSIVDNGVRRDFSRGTISEIVAEWADLE